MCPRLEQDWRLELLSFILDVILKFKWLHLKKKKGIKYNNQYIVTVNVPTQADGKHAKVARTGIRN